MRNTKITETLLFGILFLFFLQSLSDFIESIYAFGLLVTAFTIEVTSIILLFTPLLLLAFRRPPARPFLLGLAIVAIAARLVEPLLAPGGKLVASGMSVGAFMMLFPLLLHRRIPVSGWQAANGLVIALALSIFLKTLNSSLDISESAIYQIPGWLLGILVGVLLRQMDLSSGNELIAGGTASGGRVTGLAIGLASIIEMLYFALASPAVIARWTEGSYPAIVITLVIVLTLFGTLLATKRFPAWLTRSVVLGWNVLFVLMLVLTILPHQISFPSSQDAYPFSAPAVSPWTAVFPFLMLVLSPVIFVNFLLFLRALSQEKPSLRQLGAAFGAAALFFLIMVFFHVFTTIYDYVPVIGPFFRDRFWFVYLLVGLGMGLPVLLVRKGSFPPGQPEVASPLPPMLLGSLALLSVIGLYSAAARPVAPQDDGQLRVMTYNIQQGFDEDGNKNLEGQLAAIGAPDVLGLQESDTARIANGNVDVVRYFADHLDMYSYYGPTTTTGTFGIALLSKYPIQNPTTFFMYSTGEQTAAIHAEISWNGKAYNIFVTHLGNGGPMFQLEELLARVQDLQNVIVMGDFNFSPSTEQYKRITQTLEDSWLLEGPAWKSLPGFSDEDRIDHIFVSPGLAEFSSTYIMDSVSDHPYVYLYIDSN